MTASGLDTAPEAAARPQGGAGETLLHILLSAERGGVERDALQAIRHLPELRHRVLLLRGGGPMAGEYARLGAAVDQLPPRGGASGRCAAAVRDYARLHRPAAAIHWHGMPLLPQVIHALNPLGVRLAAHAGNPATGLPRRVDWRFLLLGLRYPARGPLPVYICASRYIADSMDASRYLRRFPRVVIPNPVEVPESAPHEPGELDPGRPLTVGMLARLDAIKDHATVIRALARLRESYPQARLELAGDGSERPALERLAASLGLAEAVTFLGQVSDVYGAMAGWDLFAYATTDREGLGNAVVEAMMLGLPCVVTDVGPMRETCGGPARAALVPPADPGAMAAELARLAADVNARRRLGASAREGALATYHPAASARRHAELLFPGTVAARPEV